MKAEIIHFGWEEMIIFLKTLLLIFKELWYIWLIVAVVLIIKLSLKYFEKLIKNKRKKIK